jgi:putative tryptophan/tyrosine transport system substrate-binding protein
VELLGEVVPKLTRVAVVWNPGNAANVVQLKETQSAAAASRVTARPVDVRRPDELEAAFVVMKQERAQAFIVLADPMLLGERRRIADLAVNNGLPSIYNIPEHVDAGGLMSYAADRLDVFRRAALHVDKILKGAKPADLPVEQPTKFELMLNVKTAKALGLTIPQSVLLRADRVIE